MVVRVIRPGELLEYDRVGSIAFRTPDAAERDLTRTDEERQSMAAMSWAAFTDDGRIAGRMRLHPFQAYFEGQALPLIGVGGVCTLPEFRREGAIRELFRAWMPLLRAQGAVFSALYPFSHEYYRQFGYETAWTMREYALMPGSLAEYRSAGRCEVEMLTGEPCEELNALLASFSSQYSLALRRDAYAWSRWLHGDPLKEMRYRYILRREGRIVAWCCTHIKDYSTMVVEDVAWEGAEGFHCLMGFLSLQNADSKLLLRLPDDVDPMLFVPAAYEVVLSIVSRPMLRVLDVPRALAVAGGDCNAAYTIRVRDAFLSENDGVYSVRKSVGDEASVRRTDGRPDIDVSVETLAQMLSGCIGLSGALLRADTRLYGNRACLETVFRKKPVWHPDHY